MRNGEIATLGPWVLKSDVPSGWLGELLEEGHSRPSTCSRAAAA
jgi:hypothetical protein